MLKLNVDIIDYTEVRWSKTGECRIEYYIYCSGDNSNYQGKAEDVSHRWIVTNLVYLVKYETSKPSVKIYD